MDYRVGVTELSLKGKSIVKKMIMVGRTLDWIVHGFIFYLIVGEILFMVCGIILPTFIF